MEDSGPQQEDHSQKASYSQNESAQEQESGSEKGSGPQRGSDLENESDPQQESDPEQAGKERKDAGPEQEDSKRLRLSEMEDPYRGPDGRGGISAHGIEGETNLRRAKEYAEMIVDTVREGLLVLNFDLRVEAANESFYRMFEVSPDETEGRLVYELGNGQWDIPELRKLLGEILPQRRVITGFEVTHEFENIGRRVMRLNARQLNDHQRILLAIEDITEGEEAEKRLRASEEKLRKLNRSLEDRVEKRARQVRELTSHITRAEQRERRRLASLLHDDLQQRLYGNQLQVQSLRDTLAENGQTELAGQAEAVASGIEEVIQSLRRLSVGMSPPLLESEGLTAALEWLRSHMEETRGLEVDLSAEREFRVKEEMQVLLFQTARELLSNVAKHAGVGEATARLFEEEGNLVLEIEDEGDGFDPEEVDLQGPKESFGLTAARERLRLFDGNLTARSAKGEGTRVTVRLPLERSLKPSSDFFASGNSPAEEGSAEETAEG